MILERLDRPVLNTEYYVPNNDENDMPNCTKYCHDRAQEICENIFLKLFKNISEKGFPMADKWVEYSALPTGTELKPFSIACFSGVGGSIHVAFIERVNSDGTCLISDSRSDPDKTLRNDRFWRLVDNVTLKVGKIPTGISGVGELLGFQYLPVKDIRTKRDAEKTQLEVSKTRLRCRSSYGLNAPIINEGCYVPVGIYDVLETKEADGYTWCLVDVDPLKDEQYWVAHDPSWAKLYKVEPIVPADDFEKDLEKFVASVRKEHKTNIVIKESLQQIAEIIAKLSKL